VSRVRITSTLIIIFKPQENSMVYGKQELSRPLVASHPLIFPKKIEHERSNNLLDTRC
jgi:hypothetical protein